MKRIEEIDMYLRRGLPINLPSLGIRIDHEGMIDDHTIKIETMLMSHAKIVKFWVAAREDALFVDIYCRICNFDAMTTSALVELNALNGSSKARFFKYYLDNRLALMSQASLEFNSFREMDKFVDEILELITLESFLVDLIYPKVIKFM